MKKYLAIFVLMAVASCNRGNKAGYTVPVVNPTETYDNRSVGVSANDFLAANKYKAINIQFCYVTRHPFPDEVITAAVDFFNQYCHKPGGVNVSTMEIPEQGGELYVNDLMTIEKIYRKQYQVAGYNGADTLGVFVLLTEADYYQDNVLGVAYKNSSIALFDGIISDNSGGLAQPDRTTVMTAVLQHEIGHLLGLVNIGTHLQTPHQDEAHGKHCKVPGCLMNYQVQTTDILNVLTGNTVPVLDAECERDLRANGGK